MKATYPSGNLKSIPDCEIHIPSEGGIHLIDFKILPEITDSKSAQYNEEPIIGRSMPIKTYSHSDTRSISMTIHFVILKDSDALTNMQHKRALQSAVYPRESSNNPYLPPPVCSLKIGTLLSKDFICAILRSYSVTYPTDVAWYYKPGSSVLYLPYKFDMALVWDEVRDSVDLPGQNRIITDW